jgi:hypothetical protein
MADRVDNPALSLHLLQRLWGDVRLEMLQSIFKMQQANGVGKVRQRGAFVVLARHVTDWQRNGRVCL